MNDPVRRDPEVFVDGSIVNPAEARISLSDRGLLYGFGFFETFRTSGGRPHHWQFNHTRLKEACMKSGLVLPASFLAADESKLFTAVDALLRQTSQADAVFRYTVTAGSGDRPTEFMTVRPLPAQPKADGISLRVLKVARDTGEWIPRPKSLNHLNATLGQRELQERNVTASDEGLYLSREEGLVVETPRQNIVWIREGRIQSPMPTLGAVAGTCIAWMLSRGETIQPARATLAEFLEAEAIFACNSVRGITPVSEVWDVSDATRLGSYDSANHPLIVRLQREWHDSLVTTARGKTSG